MSFVRTAAACPGPVSDSVTVMLCAPLVFPITLTKYLSGLDLPLRPDEVVTPDLPAAGDVWERLTTLYSVGSRQRRYVDLLDMPGPVASNANGAR
jgi:hypothetical protein